MQEHPCIACVGSIFFCCEGCFWFGCLLSLSSTCTGCYPLDRGCAGACSIHASRKAGTVVGSWSRDPWWQRWRAVFAPGEGRAVVGTGLRYPRWWSWLLPGSWGQELVPGHGTLCGSGGLRLPLGSEMAVRWLTPAPGACVGGALLPEGAHGERTSCGSLPFACPPTVAPCLSGGPRPPPILRWLCLTTP